MKRYNLLDILRAVSVISMIAYHTVWDIVNIFEKEITWFDSDIASLWQASIRWSFIMISGFSWSLGKKHLRRALTVLLCSGIITVFTHLFVPKGFIIFGVLTLLGCAMLLTIPLDRLFSRLQPIIGLLICAVLFLIFKNTELGTVGIWKFTAELPDFLFANDLTAFLGFPTAAFSSADYVPLIPWLFVFWMGYFLYHCFKRYELLKYLSCISLPPLEFIGKHALIIYMLHQPVCYAILFVVFNWLKL